ncbi:monooxygenase [Mycena alexandri]|uniref:Monooxygenase n=1 Tax=Mycena alexandri TaxID=1745969 RepID=A0AAD6WJX7_9AGAR|nr:monooxygenase [Mycena alexandri]
MSPPPRNIAIIGAGLGGLLLARILQLENVSFTIYESDADASLRATFGGSLDLKYETGQRAMHAAGLHAEFLKLARPEGEQMRILDKTGKIYHDVTETGASFYNPEIDRGQLRTLILDSLTPGTVQWGHKATAVRKDADSGKYTIEFASGLTVENVDIVVGADGAWSRVRPLIWDAKPIYSGVTFLETKIDMAKNAHLSALIGKGTMTALSDGKGLLAQLNSTHAILYSALRVPEDWAKTSAVAQAETTAEKLALMLEEFGGWHEELRELIRVGENPTVRPIYALPSDSLPRTKTDNIVLLGDAAHVLSPFGGDGANLAMADAADLAKVLVSGQPLEKYEKLMRERGNEACKGAAQNLELFFGENAAAVMAKFFDMPWGAGFLLKAWLYFRSFFW